MPRYAFKLFNGITSDVRFVVDDYTLQTNEVEGFGDILPIATPIPTPNMAFTTALYADTEFQNLVFNLQERPPAQIKNYVQNNIVNTDPSVKIMLAKILLILARTL